MTMKTRWSVGSLARQMRRSLKSSPLRRQLHREAVQSLCWWRRFRNGCWGALATCFCKLYPWSWRCLIPLMTHRSSKYWPVMYVVDAIEVDAGYTSTLLTRGCTAHVTTFADDADPQHRCWCLLPLPSYYPAGVYYIYVGKPWGNFQGWIYHR